MVVAGLVLIIIVAALNAAPLAYFTMLFLGNLGVNLGFWAVLPGAMAFKIAHPGIFTSNKPT